MRSASLFSTAASLVLAFFLATVPVVQAQVVSSGLTGVVRDENGVAVAGATVTAKHLPTGTVYSATTSSTGRYSMRGLIVGGPYAVQARLGGHQPVEQTVFTALGNDVDASFQFEASTEDVVTLEALVVEASASDLDPNASGAGSLLSSQRLEGKPTTQRSIADLVSASPLVTLRATIGDREESQLSAVGQNNRYNSILIDGARINDQFGLNMTGLASFYNPLSIDTIEQLSVQVSPYDVRQAGFTGASINAVTKSGTNEFHGSAYYVFGGDELWGQQFQGEDIATLIGTGRKVVPKLERTTYGFTLGGPIVKNRLFFFANYEKFERITAPGAPGLLAVNDSDMSAFIARLDQYNTASGQAIDWGENIVGSPITNETSDEKILGKLDWNINENHRASLRYSTTEGFLPQYGKFQNTQVINNAGLTSSGATALSTHIYTQERVEEVWAGQVFSQWTPDFRTEVKVSSVTQDQETPLSVIAPEIAVFGLRGTNRNGQPITDAAYVAGTEFSRQGNQINVDSINYSAIGEYTRGNVLFSAGVEREENDFFNLFRQGSFGTVVFRNLDDFLNDRPARIERTSFDLAARGNAGDISDFASTGIFAQAKWDVNSRLWVKGGLRYEWAETNSVPPFNQAFFSATGFNNTGTVDGSDSLSPRVEFNYALDDERSMQVRGGIGHFLGRAPWVIFSNSYNRPGVGDFTVIQAPPTGQTTLPQGTFTSYLQAFDPENPIGSGPDNPALRREINWVDDNISLPAVWRGNLAFDLRLPKLGATFSTEVVHTINDEQFYIINENLRPSTAPAADGRARFSGSPSQTANARFGAFTDLYRVTNVSTGKSTYVSFMIDRPMQKSWAYNASFTIGKATDAQSFGQTTASGQWQRNVVFNQSTVEESTSDFEVRNRLQLSLTKEFQFLRNQATQVSLYYEGRTGEPFSWTYSSDLNGDGQSANDTVAVPTDVNDTRFNFTGMPQSMIDQYFAYLESSGLSKYAGGYAPKNAFNTPVINRLDLKLSHTVRLREDVSTEFFLDFINFGAFVNEDFFGGYYIEANQKHFGSEMFRRNRLGPAVYGTDGRIIPQKSSATAASFTAFNPDQYVYENGQSRWKIQVGARLRF